MAIDGIAGGIKGSYAIGTRLGIAPDLSSTPVSDGESKKTFSSLVKDAASSGINTIRKGELVAAEGLRGTADVQDVIQATIAAETTLHTLVAMRDKVVQAYQEVMRMPV